MAISLTSMTRRQALRVTGLSGVMLHIPMLARAGQTPESHLRAQLTQLNHISAPDRFDLIEFVQTAHADEQHIRALIRLSWGPGVRQRYVSATAQTEAAAIATILAQVKQDYARAIGSFQSG